MTMPSTKPLSGGLSTPTVEPSEGEITHGEALRQARAIEHMMQTEGWQVLCDSVDDFLEHDQNTFAKAQVPSEQAVYAMRQGRWRGLKDWPSIALAIVRRGEQSKAELERQGA